MSTTSPTSNNNNAGKVTPNRDASIALDELDAFIKACVTVKKQDLGADVDSALVNARLLRLYADLKGAINILLKEAEAGCIAFLKIGHYLGKEVDGRYVGPFIGRGGGRDCAVKGFYHGSGIDPLLA